MKNFKELTDQIADLENQLLVMKKKLKIAEKDLQKKIIQKPLESVGIAYGAGIITGFILTMFMGRRR